MTRSKLLSAPAASLVLMGSAVAACLAGFLAPRAGVYGSAGFFLLAGACVWLLARMVAARLKGLGRPGRGSARTWGSVLLHLGVGLSIAAGFLAYAAGRRATVDLIEGESVRGREEEFGSVEKGILAGRFDLPFGLTMGRVRSEYWEDGSLRSLQSSLRVDGVPGPEQVEVPINGPLKRSGVTVYQSGRHGYSVSVRVARPGGREAVTHFLLEAPSRVTRSAVGGADFPTTPYAFKLRLEPGGPGDAVLGGGGPRISGRISSSGRTLYDGPLSFDRPVRVGNDLVSVADLRLWGGLVLVKDLSSWPALLGFLLASMGALLIYAVSSQPAAHG